MTEELEITTPTPTEIVQTRVVDAPHAPPVWEVWSSPAPLGPEVDLRPEGVRFVWRVGDGLAS